MIPPTATVHRVCAIVIAIVKFRGLMLMEIKMPIVSMNISHDTHDIIFLLLGYNYCLAYISVNVEQFVLLQMTSRDGGLRCH